MPSTLTAGMLRFVRDCTRFPGPLWYLALDAGQRRPSRRMIVSNLQLFLAAKTLRCDSSLDGWALLKEERLERSGVTTNPSLIAKEGKPIEEQVRAICDIIDGDISAEVVATEFKAMVDEGRKLSKIHKNIIVKLPLLRDGVQACKLLQGEGIRVNVTLCFQAAQGLLVAKAGAYIISPFVGRIDDMGADGMILVHDLVQIYKNYNFKTQILAASLRTPNHVIAAAKAGAHIGTLPFKTLDSLFSHPLTDKGLEQFLKDYAKVFGAK